MSEKKTTEALASPYLETLDQLIEVKKAIIKICNGTKRARLLKKEAQLEADFQRLLGGT